jgi:hypothetical protein
MIQSIFCTVPNTKRAERILSRLRSLGFTSKDVSVLFAEGGKMKALVHKKSSKAATGAAAGVGTGGVVGAVLGWLAGIGSLAIPGMGAFIAAGPIMAALSGGAIGGAVGGLIGSLIGLGIPEVEAKKFEAKLKEGDLFISVRTQTNEENEAVKEVFLAAAADNVTHSASVVA